MKHFFITGMGRCGTTFLANFMTYDGVFCHHDAILGCPDVDALADKMTLRDRYMVGDSDSGLLFCLPQLKARFPGAPLVVVHREPRETAYSMLKAGIHPGPAGYDILLDLHEKALKMASEVVRFEELFLTDTLRYLWQNLTGLRFDAQRAEMLVDMRIKPDLDRHRMRSRAVLGSTLNRGVN